MRVGIHNTRAYSHSCTVNARCNNGHFCTDRQACKDAGDGNLHVKVIQHQYQVSEGAVSPFNAYKIFYNV